MYILLISYSIILVQGLGAHPFHTWVKKIPASDAFQPTRLRDRAQFWKRTQRQGKDGNEGPTEVMWPRDLLVPSFQHARIATYSYKSDWRDRNVKTSLRECAEQLLNVLFQHRQHASVSHLEVHMSIRLYFFSQIAMTGTSKTTRPNRTQSWRSCHTAGLFRDSRKARCHLLMSRGTRHCCPSTIIY